MKPNSYPETRMGTLLARNWQTVAVRGVVAILFGIVVFLWPGITLASLVVLFGFFALIGGFLFLVAAIKHRRMNEPWWLLLLEGILGIAIGIIVLALPEITGLFLVYVIAAWAIISGIVQIIAAIQLRRQIVGEWLLITSGIASLLFGLLLAIWPVAGVLAVLWVIAAYAIFFGVLQLILAFRLRNWQRREPPTVI